MIWTARVMLDAMLIEMAILAVVFAVLEYRWQRSAFRARRGKR